MPGRQRRPTPEEYEAAAHVARFKGDTDTATKYQAAADNRRENEQARNQRNNQLVRAFINAWTGHETANQELSDDTLRALRRGVRAMLKLVTPQDITDAVDPDNDNDEPIDDTPTENPPPPIIVDPPTGGTGKLG